MPSTVRCRERATQSIAEGLHYHYVSSYARQRGSWRAPSSCTEFVHRTQMDSALWTAVRTSRQAGNSVGLLQHVRSAAAQGKLQACLEAERPDGEMLLHVAAREVRVHFTILSSHSSCFGVLLFPRRRATCMARRVANAASIVLGVLMLVGLVRCFEVYLGWGRRARCQREKA